MGEVISTGRFWLPVDLTFPLTEITEAHRTSEQGRVRGRLVLVIGPASDVLTAEVGDKADPALHTPPRWT
nr:zinc-binding dehydrogenase [Streptosporangium subroseum]